MNPPGQTARRVLVLPPGEYDRRAMLPFTRLFWPFFHERMYKFGSSHFNYQAASVKRIVVFSHETNLY